MSFREKIEAGQFVVTGEIGPPKGVNIEGILEEAQEYLKGRVDAVNVTDLQSSVMRVGSMAICKKLLDVGIEPIYQLTCRDRNRLALQSDLLSAYVLGIRNVLALTGDHVSLGDHQDAKPVFDLDSVLLLEAIGKLQSGKDIAGNDLDGAPGFFPGAIVTPCADPIEPQILKLEKKVICGARFIQTQAVYDAKQFEEFMKKVEAADVKVPILLGVVILKSPGMAKFMNANVAGVNVPDALIEELADTPKGDRRKKSVEIAARLIKQMKDMCQGVHLMTLGWDKEVPNIVEQAEL